MFVVQEGRDEMHYCLPCAQRFVTTARKSLDDLGQSIAGAL